MIRVLLAVVVLSGCAVPVVDDGLLRGSGERTMPPAGYLVYCEQFRGQPNKPEECGE